MLALLHTYISMRCCKVNKKCAALTLAQKGLQGLLPGSETCCLLGLMHQKFQR